MKEQMIKDFQKVYDYPCENVYFAPGRVNLIGEHIDYNGGYVFPCALTLGTYAAFAKRKDSKIRFYSLNFESIGILESDINSIKKENSWADYPKGVIEVLKQEGHKFPCGFDVLFYGNLPNGAGLSSSASIEILTCVFLNDSFNLNISKKETAFISQKAENSFVGVNSGIMDQFACSMGVKDRAILLNCSTFEYELVPLNLKDSSILIINTNKKRNLTDSKYNERRSECEAALKILQTKLDIKDLCSLNPDDFEKNKSLIKDNILLRRAKHCVYENFRAKQASQALKKDDLEFFGNLMRQSHISLKDDYEVSAKELDIAVDLANRQKGSYGARMTGAGFGGCAVSIIKNENIDEAINNIAEEYREGTGLGADFYKVTAANGGHLL